MSWQTSGRKQSFSKLLDFSYIYMYYKPFDLGTKTFSKALKGYHIIFALTNMLTKFVWFYATLENILPKGGHHHCRRIRLGSAPCVTPAVIWSLGVFGLIEGPPNSIRSYNKQRPLKAYPSMDPNGNS